MLCKPLFIVHVRLEGLFKVILQYKNEAPSCKSRHSTCIMGFYKINVKFQVSVQINEVLLYKIKIKQTKNKLKFKKGVGIAIKSKETSSKPAISS